MLNQPYPLREVTSKSLLGILLAGCFVAGFLLVFQPFGLFYWKTEYKNAKIMGYGLVTIVLLWFDFFVIRRQWKSFFSENTWKVWKEIAWTLFILSSVTVGNYLYNVFVLQTATFQLRDFFIALFTTFTIGIFPTLGFVLTNYIIQLRKYSQPVTIPDTPVVSDTELTLTAENEKDQLRLQTADLLYIESSDNYCTVYFLKNSTLARGLIRSSLTRLEGQIASASITRCHRSYLVNLQKVARISGNAQGYKLHLEHVPDPVPVARKYSQIISNPIEKA
jgi:hypothetical protein